MKSTLIISALVFALLLGSCRDKTSDTEERQDTYENSTDPAAEVAPAVPDTTGQSHPTQQDTM